MSALAEGPRHYRFGVFEVDFGAVELRKGGSRLKLTGQPMQILERLLERAGNVVTRDELRHDLWHSDTYVDFEHNLNSAVKRLRAALGDSADSPRFIETLPRRGYRFLAPVEALPATAHPDRAAHEMRQDRLDTAAPGPGGKRRGIRLAMLGATAVAAIVGGYLAWGRGTGAANAIRSVAVLPFENMSGDPDQAYVADGMTEMLIAALAQIRPLKVVSRTSVMRYRGTRSRVPDIARELGVDAVVEGSIVRSADRIRVTTQLIHAPTDRHLWAANYEGQLGDLLAFQGEVARAVAREIDVKLSPPEQARLARGRRVDPAVEEAYLKARFFWNQRTDEGLARAIQYFEQALVLDPTYAPAEAGLADAYNLAPRYGPEPTRASLAKARAHALAALQLDPMLSEAHAALAKVRYSLDWDWRGADQSFRRAIELSPGNATAHHWHSVFLLALGKVDEALQAARRARELDPLSAVINLHLAWSLYLADQSEEALAGVMRTLELEPRYANAHYLLGWIRLRREELEPARAEFLKAIELTNSPREYQGGLVAAQVALGQLEEARRVLAALEATDTTAEAAGQPLVWAYVALGRTDDAFRVLSRDFENRSVCFYIFHLTNHWYLAPLRAEPRLQALYHTAGLDEVRLRRPLRTARHPSG